MAREISPEKLQDMVRSILPSKNREAARKAKTTLKRRVRRTVRVDVRVDDPRADLRRDANQSYNVSWRRQGDKLNHFMRWCRAITKGMTTCDALAFVRRILPKNLIGDHAYSHWETECRYRGPRLPFAEQHRRARQHFLDRTTHRLRRALSLEPHRLGELNAEIKRRKPPEEPRRLLCGMADVDAFVATVLFGSVNPHRPYDWAPAFEIERECLGEMLAEVEIANGPKRAVERRFPRYVYG